MSCMNIRSAINAELKRQGRSAYWLAKQVEKHMSNTTVYEFLKEGKDAKQLTAANLGYVLDALGITLTPTAPAAETTPAKRKAKK